MAQLPGVDRRHSHPQVFGDFLQRQVVLLTPSFGRPWRNSSEYRSEILALEPQRECGWDWDDKQAFRWQAENRCRFAIYRVQLTFLGSVQVLADSDPRLQT